MKRLILLFLLGQSSGLLAEIGQKEGRYAITGGIGNVSVSWLGPITWANLKLGAGGEYWFNKNLALGVDLGLGSGGYGKVVGTTSKSLVNLKTGDFILDPGFTGTIALNPMGHFRLYSALRVGFPLYSGYSGALSLGPSLGALIAINDWVALDLAATITVVANFKLNYLATVLSLGSIGFRVFI